jgi:UDPglucose 6-dehydrogenase
MRSFSVKKNKEIGVLGLWHLGSVYSACLAELGFHVTAWDFDSKIIKNLNKSIPPIEEPLLKKTIKEHLDRNLFFTNTPEVAIRNKSYIFVTFDVPVDDNDKIDTTIVDKAFALINKYISPRTTMIVSSQLPVGYSRKWLEKIGKKEPTVNIIYFPENLRLGTAFDSFLKPDRVIIGASNKKVLDQFEKDFVSFNCPFIKIGLESAEMAKHALNSYLAMMISFSSEIGDLCEILGSNIEEVVSALKTERRISPYAPLNPGLGFAGGTLGRDIQTLRKLAKTKNYNPILLNSIYRVNQNRIPNLLKKIKTLLPSLQGKNIGILGLTYKPNTNTLRRSMSLELAGILKKEGASISAFDPAIKKKIDKFNYIDIKRAESDFFQDTDLIVLMTEWPTFRKIDWGNNAKLMKNKFIIDTKNFFEKKFLENKGFRYVR